jgi:hypothetical protein
MRSLPIRPAANSVKILTAGTLLTASAAGCVLSAANAADAWTARALPIAQFTCLSSNCEAGGVGYVASGKKVGFGTDKPVGEWERTVAIQCKMIIPGRPPGYLVEVRDNKWKGWWIVYKMDMAQAIDDTGIPSCFKVGG